MCRSTDASGALVMPRYSPVGGCSYGSGRPQRIVRNFCERRGYLLTWVRAAGSGLPPPQAVGAVGEPFPGGIRGVRVERGRPQAARAVDAPAFVGRTVANLEVTARAAEMVALPRPPSAAAPHEVCCQCEK